MHTQKQANWIRAYWLIYHSKSTAYRQRQMKLLYYCCHSRTVIKLYLSLLKSTVCETNIWSAESIHKLSHTHSLNRLRCYRTVHSHSFTARWTIWTEGMKEWKDEVTGVKRWYARECKLTHRSGACRCGRTVLLVPSIWRADDPKRHRSVRTTITLSQQMPGEHQQACG